MNAGSSTSMSGPPGGSAAAAASSVARSCGWPDSDHVPHRFLHQPQAARVAQEPGAPVDAALVREVGGPAGGGDDRPVELQPDERPRATGDVGEVAVDGRNRHDRRRRVVRAHRCDDGGRRQSRAARAAPPARRLAPHPVARAGAAARSGVRDAPATRSTTARCAASTSPVVDAFVASVRSSPGEPERQQVGEQHDVGGTFETAAALVGHELVQGVERQELLAVDRIEVGGVDDPMDVFDDRARAVVAIGDRLVDELSVAVEQGVVDAPGVDADRLHLGKLAGQLAEPIDHLLEQRANGPPEMTVGLDESVGETVDRLEGHGAASTRPAITRPPDAPMSTAAKTRRGMTSQRRNAAATPASTGISRPVV